MTRSPKSRGAGRAGSEGLHVRLINGETIRLRRFEIARVLMHRYLVLAYLAIAGVLIVIDPSGQQVSTPLRLRSVVYGIGMISTIVGLGGICMLAEVLRGGRGRPVVVQGSVVMFATSILALGATQVVALAVVPTHVVQVKVFLILAVFYYVLTEVLIQLAVWLLLERILDEVRARPDGSAHAEGVAEASAQVQAGGRVFETGSILHLEARGNYVAIHSDSGVTEVPGPFSALLDQMPEGIGLRIHRSHWVARRAVVGQRKKGRDLLVDLAHGGSAPVAMPRHREVLDWLASDGDQRRG